MDSTCSEDTIAQSKQRFSTDEVLRDAKSVMILVVLSSTRKQYSVADLDPRDFLCFTRPNCDSVNSLVTLLTGLETSPGPGSVVVLSAGR